MGQQNNERSGAVLSCPYYKMTYIKSPRLSFSLSSPCLLTSQVLPLSRRLYDLLVSSISFLRIHHVLSLDDYPYSPLGCSPRTGQSCPNFIPDLAPR